MLKNTHINLQVVDKVAGLLGQLNDEVVYVGGAVASLYITEKAADLPRPTKDVDVSIQLGSISEWEQLRERLAQLRIFPDQTSKVMYRYKYEDIIIDFIPTEATAIGPTNRWLKPGFEHAFKVELGENHINILPLPFYLATKWEAYKGRGGEDPRTSHDFEDIIYILDNNQDVFEKVTEAPEDVKKFLASMAKEILKHNSFPEIVESHMEYSEIPDRFPMLKEKLEAISNL
jgi:predicted nucleotidyltransferase